MIYPWQQAQWQWFLQAKAMSRLPHALLLHGIPGVGKAHFADHITRAMLCQRTDICHQDADCASCHLIQGRCHPNVLWIEPEKSGHPIKIDQIRYVIDFINQSALQNGYRFVIIHPAHEMNNHAANALLKTLEEPSAKALIILISQQLTHLPATIISRCQRLLFQKPKREEALLWLEKKLQNPLYPASLLLDLAQGAPLYAERFLLDDFMTTRKNLYQAIYQLSQKTQNPSEISAALANQDVLILFDFLFSFILDLLRLQQGSEHIVNTDYAQELSTLKNKTTPTYNSRLLEQLQKLRAQMTAGINLNKQLMWENLLISWSETL